MSKKLDKEAKKTVNSIFTLTTWIIVLTVIISVTMFVCGIVFASQEYDAMYFLIYSVIAPTIYIVVAVLINIGLKWMACVLNTLIEIKNNGDNN